MNLGPSYKPGPPWLYVWVNVASHKRCQAFSSHNTWNLIQPGNSRNWKIWRFVDNHCCKNCWTRKFLELNYIDMSSPNSKDNTWNLFHLRNSWNLMQFRNSWNLIGGLLTATVAKIVELGNSWNKMCVCVCACHQLAPLRGIPGI